ncbi:MAG: hypothetical protein LBK25_04085 [Treponema sp.]|jgi:hypothetical protein|nr:hypothetical protein [Treponema sp.]
MIIKKLSYAVSVFFAIFFYGCPYYQPEAETVPPVKGLVLTEDTLDITSVDFPEEALTISAGERQKIDFGTDSGKTIKLPKLDNNTVYLVKVNRSGAAVKAQDTGGHIRTDGERSVLDPVFTEGAGHGETEFALNNGTFIRTEHHPAQEFNHNPPPPSSSTRSLTPALAASTAQVGDVKPFWVQDKNEKWVQIRAALRATANHANVWVAAANFSNSSRLPIDNKITAQQAQGVADKFDIIYEKETALFGYEFGGGLQPSDKNYGGRDGDVKIQILVYDIEYDYSQSQTSGIFGYFWGKDYYNLAGYPTNLAEIFYIDSHFTDAIPEGIYSTLVHEFQHMINFNERYVKKGKSSATWFDEMLSQIAEDVIDAFIGIDVNNTEHPSIIRIPRFLDTYWGRGFTEWRNGDLDESLVSYANTYAFGAYLVRNFGGTALVKGIMESNYDNLNAIKAALEQRGSSFEEALAQYGEALVFTDDTHASFNKTATEAINGVDYSFVGFNLWNVRNYSSGQYYGGKFTYPSKGPVVIDTSFISSMDPYSIFVQSCAKWKDTSEALTFKLKKPVDSIDFYIFVK